MGKQRTSGENWGKNFINYTPESTAIRQHSVENKYDNYLLPGSDQNASRARQQGIGSELFNGIGGAALKVIPNIISNVAAISDLEDYYNQDDEVGNFVSRSMQELTSEIDGFMPIYEKNPGEPLSFGDSAWWTKNMSQVLGSGLEFALTGSGLAGVTGKALSMVGATGKVGTGVNLGMNVLALNQAEALLSAQDVYKKAYDDNKARGAKEEDAKKIAADAAAYTININRLNMPLNLTSSLLFLKTPLATRSLVSNINKANTLKRFGAESGQEYLEETINFVGEQEGNKKGAGQAFNGWDVVKDIFSAEGIEAGLLGALGGLSQTAFSEGVNEFNGKNKSERDRYKTQQELLKTYDDLRTSKPGQEKFSKIIENAVVLSTYQNKIYEADVNNNVAEATRLRQESLQYQALNAFKSGTTEGLLSTFDYAINQQGAEEKHGKEYAANAIKARDLVLGWEKQYNNFIGAYPDNKVEHLFNNIVNKNRLIEEIENIENQLPVLQSKINKLKATGFASTTEEAELAKLVARRDAIKEEAITNATDLGIILSKEFNEEEYKKAKLEQLTGKPSDAIKDAVEEVKAEEAARNSSSTTRTTTSKPFHEDINNLSLIGDKILQGEDLDENEQKFHDLHEKEISEYVDKNTPSEEEEDNSAPEEVDDNFEKIKTIAMKLSFNDALSADEQKFLSENEKAIKEYSNSINTPDNQTGFNFGKKDSPTENKTEDAPKDNSPKDYTSINGKWFKLKVGDYVVKYQVKKGKIVASGAGTKTDGAISNLKEFDKALAEGAKHEKSLNTLSIDEVLTMHENSKNKNFQSISDINKQSSTTKAAEPVKEPVKETGGLNDIVGKTYKRKGSSETITITAVIPNNGRNTIEYKNNKDKKGTFTEVQFNTRIKDGTFALVGKKEPVKATVNEAANVAKELDKYVGKTLTMTNDKLSYKVKNLLTKNGRVYVMYVKSDGKTGQWTDTQFTRDIESGRLSEANEETSSSKTTETNTSKVTEKQVKDVFAVIVAQDKVSPYAIQKALSLDAKTVSAALAKLEEDGFISGAVTGKGRTILKGGKPKRKKLSDLPKIIQDKVKEIKDNATNRTLSKDEKVYEEIDSKLKKDIEKRREESLASIETRYNEGFDLETTHAKYVDAHGNVTEINMTANVMAEDRARDIKDAVNKKYDEEYEAAIKHIYKRVTTYTATKEFTENATTISAKHIGTGIDGLVRDFFENGNVNYGDYFNVIESEAAFNELLEGLARLNQYFIETGQAVLANDILLYNDDIAVAGTVDLLTVDAEGVFRIFDLKTMRGNQLTDVHKSGANKGKPKYDTSYEEDGESNREKHQNQLSMYRILLANTHGIVASELFVIPVVVGYEPGSVSTSKAKMLDMIPVVALDKYKDATLNPAENKVVDKEIDDNDAGADNVPPISDEGIPENDLHDEHEYKSHTAFRTTNPMYDEAQKNPELYANQIRWQKFVDSFKGDVNDYRLKVLTKSDPEYDSYRDSMQEAWEKRTGGDGLIVVLVDKYGKEVLVEDKPLVSVILKSEIFQDGENSVSLKNFAKDRDLLKTEEEHRPYMPILHNLEKIEEEYNKMWNQAKEFRTKLLAGKVKYLPITEKGRGVKNIVEYSGIEGRLTDNIYNHDFLITPGSTTAEGYSKYSVDPTTGQRLRTGVLYAKNNDRWEPLSPRTLLKNEVDTIISELEKLTTGKTEEGKTTNKQVVKFLKDYIFVKSTKPDTMGKFDIFIAGNTIHFGDSKKKVNVGMKNQNWDELRRFLKTKNRQVDINRLNNSKATNAEDSLSKESVSINGETISYRDFLLKGDKPAFQTNAAPIGEPKRKNAYFVYSPKEGELVKKVEEKSEEVKKKAPARTISRGKVSRKRQAELDALAAEEKARKEELEKKGPAPTVDSSTSAKDILRNKRNVRNNKPKSITVNPTLIKELNSLNEGIENKENIPNFIKDHKHLEDDQIINEFKNKHCLK
jgi:hypothetical protein